MKDYKTRKDRMSQFRRENLLIDIAVIGFCVAVGIVFALLIADFVWGQIAVTEWLASFIV